MSDAVPVAEPAFYDVIDATWPAARVERLGAVTLREGRGGGSRVSAATVDGEFEPADLENAISAMRDMGQTPLFMIRDGDDALDHWLAEQDFKVKDPVFIRTGRTADLAEAVLPRVTTFTVWPPLAIQKDIWTEGGINAPRLAIMKRVVAPKTSIFGRVDDQPAASAFVATHGEYAMLHALEVQFEHRRKGLAKWMMYQSAQWALRNKAHKLAVLVTQSNLGANALYDQLGLNIVGGYHYRELRSA
ncbi:GNAT family N-acetyltransferase [Epibacterium ulvae]|uniref:GNAT family N-acetyltransferase n=1 Tax=Epibacterium ulvae TaxID=1156985 RepID=UPI001BFCD0BA|nr:GNAT family N-acetyltransferase [Epibacterium ulvae]MBT8153846.1 GNAT family N-acetyltransferase [Epibacterium ulvae]